jgi:ubiquitin-activating enzyme E1
LNPYVEVSNYEGEITTDFISEFDIVVFTDSADREFLIKINEFCRSQEKPIGFIWTGSLGLYGWTFVDFGPSHTVFDHNGENCLSTIITSISQDEKGVVTVNDDKRHGFEDGDWVIFREVEGMTEINEQKYQIRVISPYSFEIGDTSGYSEYTRQGIAEQVKVPRQVKFESLATTLNEPLNEGVHELQDPDMDWENMNKPFELHVILKSFLDFYAANKRYPELLNIDDASSISGIANHKVEELKKASAEWDAKVEADKKAAEEAGEEVPEQPRKPTLYRVEKIKEGLTENIS